MQDPKIVLLTGERQIGKTTVCLRLVERLREANVKVTGLVTQHTGPHDLKVVELASEKTYPLTLPFQDDVGVAVGRFRVDPAAMERSCAALEASFPTQVFILDELGPLELLQRQGWIETGALLKRQTYRAAFIVVRPELLVQAICQLPASFYTVVQVSAEHRELLPQSLANIAIEACAPPQDEASMFSQDSIAKAILD